MPAAKLPTKLHARLDELAARVRKLRVIHAVGRTAFLLPVAALGCILADAYVGLPTVVRGGLLIGWVLLAVREGWRLFQAITLPVDWEAIASAVEQEFPRLAERLTTAVELAESADESNGSPALINEVILDADSRARKLDLSTAFPTGQVTASCISALIVLLLLLIPTFFAPRGGEYLRRFFVPGYVPSKVVNYEIEVTSKESAISKGDPVTLTAIVKATKPNAELPRTATLVVIVAGKEERLAMSSDAENVWHHRRAVAEADFEFRVEAGDAVSDTHHVSVVDPVTLASARVTIAPPAYAALVRKPDQPIEGLGELVALAHSTIVFELRFSPKPTSAMIEFIGEGDIDSTKPFRQRHPLKIADDGTTKISLPAAQTGVFAIKAEGVQGVASKIPTQPLKVIVDEAPKFPRVSGIGEKPRTVRPDEKIAILCTVTDDVALAKLALEWRVNDGPSQFLLLDAPGLPTQQVEAKAALALKDRVKVGQKLECRLVATDNRDLPGIKLTPQTTYFPAKDWAEFTIDANAAPLAEQDITGRKTEIEKKLKEIKKELEEEFQVTNLLRRGTENRRTLDAVEQERLKKVRRELAETTDKLEELTKDVGVTPELARLADSMRTLAERELRDADAALNRAREEAQAKPRTEQFKKAEESLDAARRKIDELIQENERIAKERMDKHKLEEIAREQQDLADATKKADPKEAAELAKKQQALEVELAKLKELSEAIKKATEAAQAEEAKKLADAAKKIAEEMRELNDAIKKAEKNSVQERLAELKNKQEELAKKARELADKTDAASRASETPPLNPKDAENAKNALDKGALNEAAKDQEKAARELDRLARDLEQAAANSRDPREMAKQLARLQEDLRQRVAQETKDKPLDQLPAERRAALERQQEAIEKATAKLKTPQGDLPADVAKQQAAADARDAREMLKKGAEQGADKKMRETRESLEKLAEKLPTKEQRLAKAKAELANLKQQQDAIRQKADAAAKTLENQDPDAATTQQELSEKLADTAKKQAELAEKLSKLDAPGQDARKEKATDAMQKAANDMTAGRPQDAVASQQAVKRELDRLEQAMNGQKTADEKVDELAKKQRELADEAAKNVGKPDRSTQLDLQKRQGDIARDLEKLQTPEAAAAQAEAIDAAKKAEQAGNNPAMPEDIAKKTKEASDKLDQLNEQVNGQESPAEAADRLAKRQKANADEQEKRKDAASTAEARKKAAQELDELKNMRAGADAQKAKQQAQDALQRAANAVEPNNNAKAQQDAASAMKDLADKLTRKETAKSEPQPKDPADAADRLAKKQKELAERTKQELNEAKKVPGEAGEKARQDALEKAVKEQKELARQAGEMPGQDSPKDRQQAQQAMNQAREELEKQNAEGAAPKQKDAAEALERIAKKAQDRMQDQAHGTNPDLPNKAQAEEARKLAGEQRKLQEETRQAGDELAKENAPRKDNPVEDIAKQQQEIAKEAGELAKTVNDRQGAKSEQSKQASQAAEAAKKTANEVKNGDLTQARQSGMQAAEAMEKMAQDKAGGESGQKAKDLARRQQDVNQKLEEMSKDPGSGKAQQAARQQKLEEQARELGNKLDEMAKGQSGMGMGEKQAAAGEKSKEAGSAAKQSGDKMQSARQQGEKGQRDEASLSREQAALAMERAARQANEAAKELGSGEEKGGSPQAGEAMNRAKEQMNQASEKLGKGQPGEAGNAMEKAAKSLQQAAGQLGQGPSPSEGNDPKPGQGNNSQNPGGNIGGPGGKLDLRSFDEDVAKHSGKAWGELPGEIRNKIIQQMKARYGEEYATNIRYYFEQLAERK